MRNTKSMIAHASKWLSSAKSKNLMHVELLARTSDSVTTSSGTFLDFSSCSYLAYDTDSEVISRARETLEAWGTHYCVARSRYSIQPNIDLETGLTKLFGANSITFPSVTSCHMSTLPLLASGFSPTGKETHPVTMIFDEFAHASMQFLIPILAQEARIEKIRHNDLNHLEEKIKVAGSQGYRSVFVGDGLYSMGGHAPIAELLSLSNQYDMLLYLDDAHGTSIRGLNGRGYVSEFLGNRSWPECLVANFSLAKGFGCNGGGVTTSSSFFEKLIREFGVTYSFSGPLDFAMIGSALAVLEKHSSGEVTGRQQDLHKKIKLFGSLIGMAQQDFPIFCIDIGSEEKAISIAESLKSDGFVVPVVFFPVVPRDQAKLRVVIRTSHSDQVLSRLATSILNLQGGS